MILSGKGVAKVSIHGEEAAVVKSDCFTLSEAEQETTVKLTNVAFLKVAGYPGWTGKIDIRVLRHSEEEAFPGRTY